MKRGKTSSSRSPAVGGCCGSSDRMGLLDGLSPPRGFCHEARQVKRLLPLVLFSINCALPMAAQLPAPQPPLTLGVDTHLHLIMGTSARPLVRGEPGIGWVTASNSTRLMNQIESKYLFASGTRLALASVWVPPPARVTRDELSETVHQIQALHRFSIKRTEFAAVHSVAEARAALAQGRLAMVPTLEGGEGIHEVEDVDRLYAAGLRAITIVHFVDNAIGGAAGNQMGDNLLGLKASGLSEHGLTELGRAAVQRMFELGMIVDLAHASDKTAEEVLELAEARGVPVINSHSGARALSDRERNITDALALRVANTGGVVGVPMNVQQVRHVPLADRFEGFVDGSCDDIIAHWLHLAKVIGPDALVLGSDFNGFIVRSPAGGSCPHGIRNTGDMPDFFAALQSHGVPREALDGMGERLLKAWEVLEAKSDLNARDTAMHAKLVVRPLFDSPL